MPKVHVLDDRTANQIAAGEVVERPASVVKELVENALDAGSKRITVEVEGGGRTRIAVSDDGTGMSAEDAQLALQRHATSKISQAEDLLTIGTLGFRGEALPSIASVSRFELQTREQGAVGGTRIAVDGGRLVTNEPCGCPEGTRITVSDLFFNLPARLKYLKTNATELAQVGDVVARQALANPGVGLRFVSGGAPVFTTTGSGRVEDAAVAVLGREVARALMPAEVADASARVWGFVGAPAVARAGRTHQYLFINRRPVRALPLRYALEEAYSNLLPDGRYPIAILFLEVDPQLVDVNVHPGKLEVRLEREREVRGALYRAVKAALSAAGHGEVQVAQVPASFYPTTTRRGEPLDGQQELRMPGAYIAAEPAPTYGSRPAPAGAPDAAAWTQGTWTRAGSGGGNWLPGRGEVAYQPGPLPAGAFNPLRGVPVPSDAIPAAAEGAAGQEAAAAQAAPPLPTGTLPRSGAELIAALRPLGQVHRTYICCDGPDGLYLVDQHAAHERVFFERFLAAAQSAAPQIQPLLFPITLDLTPAQMALWQEFGPILTESGFEAEPFGGNTLRLQGVPSAVGDKGAARVVMDFLDQMVEDRLPPGASPLERRQRVVSAMAACKAALKGHDHLEPAEVGALLGDLAACDNPTHCPHGRPTVILVSAGELERRFGRA